MRVSLPLCAGAASYVLLLALGGRLLNDPDVYWHLTVGRWIVAHREFPHVDIFSHTMAGAPWIAKEWLAQLLYAGAFGIADWPGVVVLAAATIALAFGLLAYFLLQRLAPAPSLALVGAAFVLAAPHLLARPHALALPVMVSWVGVLMNAVEHRRPPPLALLLLMTLWANLHGSFMLGLALIAPIGLEAWWNAEATRRQVALQWIRFAALALLAACVTPYGPETIAAALRVLRLGEAMAIIGEWQPADFSRLDGFEACLLFGLAFVLYRGVVLPPLRIAVLLGLLHLALSHARNAEVLGLLAPLFVAQPLARRVGAGANSVLERDTTGSGSLQYYRTIANAKKRGWPKLRSKGSPGVVIAL